MFRHLVVTTLLMTLGVGNSGSAQDRTDAGAPDRVEEIRFRSGDIELAGRLWLPDGPGPHPAAIFLPGSGQSIRDLQLDPDPVPHRFVGHGVAFLAWDKRGVRDSGGVFEPLSDNDPDAQLARLRLLASDAAAAMEYLAGRTDIDATRIGAWAFSQGGWVAPLLEAVGVSPAFVVVVGGPAVTIGEELAYSELADAAREASRERRQRLYIDELYEGLESVEREAPDGFDPLPWLEAGTVPTLYLLGAHDLSVPTRRSVERLTALGRRRENLDYRVFRGANHGVATRDPAGVFYPALGFYETQWDFLANLGVLERTIRVSTRIRRELE